MNAEELGLQLAKLIGDAVSDSIDDISNTLNQNRVRVLLEYIPLLLWIATKEASSILPEKSIQPTIDVMTSVIIEANIDSVIKVFKRLNDGISMNKDIWLDIMRNKFVVYYRAWEGYGPDIMTKLDAECGKKAVQEFREICVVHNFVIMCLTEEEDMLRAEAQYRRHYPRDKYYAAHVGSVLKHYRRFSESVNSILSDYHFDSALASRSLPGQLIIGNQRLDGDQFIDFVAVELKKDINYLTELGIKMEKGKLAAKTGGVAWAGYEAFTGDWLSALIVGGISLLAGGITSAYKRIKLMEMKQKWINLLSELNQDQLGYLMAGLQSKYPLLLGQFQNLLQAGQ